MSAPLLQRFSGQLLERRWITGGIALLLLLVSLLLGWQWEQHENANQVRQVTVQARILADWSAHTGGEKVRTPVPGTGGEVRDSAGGRRG